MNRLIILFVNDFEKFFKFREPHNCSNRTFIEIHT